MLASTTSQAPKIVKLKNEIDDRVLILIVLLVGESMGSARWVVAYRNINVDLVVGYHDVA